MLRSVLVVPHEIRATYLVHYSGIALGPLARTQVLDVPGHEVRIPCVHELLMSLYMRLVLRVCFLVPECRLQKIGAKTRKTNTTNQLVLRPRLNFAREPLPVPGELKSIRSKQQEHQQDT